MLLELLAGIPQAQPAWLLTLVVPADGPLASRGRALDVAVRHVPMPRQLGAVGDYSLRLSSLGTAMPLGVRYALRLGAALHDVDPDVIHSHGEVGTSLRD